MERRRRSERARGLELRTERLLLRRWQPGDLEPYAALNADPVVRAHFPSTLTREESLDELTRFDARFDERGYSLWAVEVPGVADFIGFIGLNLTPWDAPFTPAVEVGWRLARSAWGNGYATEGARASLRYGFDVIGLDEIVSFTTPANVRSWKVMERIGMTRDPADDFDHPMIPVGHPMRRHVLYRVSRTTSDGSLSSRSPR
jgi:RimJ/RimL family protein N-acetyltransferase